MKRFSIWQDIKSKSLKPISKNMDVDVLIIGGGVSGISVLYQLKDTPLKTLLVEREQCGFGVTSKSTAKITYLQGSLLEKIRKFHGENIASKYLQAERDGVSLLQKPKVGLQQRHQSRSGLDLRRPDDPRQNRHHAAMEVAGYTE